MGPVNRQGRGEDRRQEQPRVATRWATRGRMNFREITMQDLRQVLRRRQAGQSARRIGGGTSLDRKTVGRYLEQAAEGGCDGGWCGDRRGRGRRRATSAGAAVALII